MDWFMRIAPIRLKLRIAFGSLTALLALVALRLLWAKDAADAALAGGLAPLRIAAQNTTVMFQLAAAATVLAAIAAVVMRRLIADPYVATVVRMEALAAGDLDSPIERTDYKDCVGRMTRAMETFRANAIAKREAEGALASTQREAAERLKSQVTGVLGEALEAMARGDLTAEIATEFPDGFGRLKDNFNAAADRLRTAIAQVQESVGLIRTSTSEVAQAAEDLARRTESQAASLEQSAAALEQTTLTVKQTAENARQATLKVGVAKQAAEDGGQVAERAQAAMALIQQSSSKIGAIVGVIDEIAYQTNLLALNANVEAARAGEAGRGFAVVANEVRSLAQRSSDAAKEIKELIAQSGDHVTNGVGLVGQSGTALGRIAEEVAAVNDLFVRIAAAAEQQSTGLSQISATIGQMDAATQENAAMVEESTAAARSLANEADELARNVEMFQTGNVVEIAPKRSATRAPSRAAAPRPAPKLKAVAGGGRAAAAVSEDWSAF